MKRQFRSRRQSIITRSLARSLVATHTKRKKYILLTLSSSADDDCCLFSILNRRERARAWKFSVCIACLLAPPSQITDSYSYMFLSVCVFGFYIATSLMAAIHIKPTPSTVIKFKSYSWKDNSRYGDEACGWLPTSGWRVCFFSTSGVASCSHLELFQLMLAFGAIKIISCRFEIVYYYYCFAVSLSSLLSSTMTIKYVSEFWWPSNQKVNCKTAHLIIIISVIRIIIILIIFFPVLLSVAMTQISRRGLIFFFCLWTLSHDCRCSQINFQSTKHKKK